MGILNTPLFQLFLPVREISNFSPEHNLSSRNQQSRSIAERIGGIEIQCFYPRDTVLTLFTYAYYSDKSGDKYMG